MYLYYGGDDMYVLTNEETCAKIGEVLAAQADKPQNIRVLIGSGGCSGYTFGLALDEVKEGDVQENIHGVNFIMESGVFETAGEIKVEWAGTGYSVQPVKPMASGCSSCTSCG